MPFFFEGMPHSTEQPEGAAPSPTYVSDFLATSDGLALIKAFMRSRTPSFGVASSSLSNRLQAMTSAEWNGCRSLDGHRGTATAKVGSPSDLTQCRARVSLKRR